MTKSKLTIRAVEAPCRRYECCVCGTETYKQPIQAVAFDEEGDEYGKVCAECLVSPESLITRAHAYATYLQHIASDLRRISIESMCSPQDLQRHIDANSILFAEPGIH